MRVCPNCNDANKYGDYEGPTCEVCGGTGHVFTSEGEGSPRRRCIHGKLFTESCKGCGYTRPGDVADGWLPDGSWKP